MNSKRIPVKAFVSCAIIGGMFTFNATVASADEPATKSSNTTIKVGEEISPELLEKLKSGNTDANKSYMRFESIDEIPPEILEKIGPELLEKAKANPGKPVTKIKTTVTKKAVDANGKEIDPELLENKGKPVHVTVLGADALSDEEIKKLIPHLADYDGEISRKPGEAEARAKQAIEAANQKLTVVSQSNEQIVFEFDNTENAEMQFDIIDLNGNIVKKVAAAGNNVTVAGLSSGTYFIKCVSNPNLIAKIVIGR